jgi:ribosome biogenesis GTPase A
MAKADLAEEGHNRAWASFFLERGLVAIPCDLKGKNAKRDIKAVSEKIREQTKEIVAKRVARGINDRTVRAMITGIPNVGKSTLLNQFSGKASARTADRPGVTKGKQWIRLDNDLELLDMPGILWPNLEDRDGARKLAVTGAIGENAYSRLDLTIWAVTWLREHRPGRLTARYGVNETIDAGRLSLYSDGLARDVKSDVFSPISADASDSVNAGGFDSANTGEFDSMSASGHDSGYMADDDSGAYDMESLIILEDIGRKRGFLRKGGVVELDKTAVVVLDEIRGGKLGRITWDEPPV